jgi:hypothetical protein
MKFARLAFVGALAGIMTFGNLSEAGHSVVLTAHMPVQVAHTRLPEIPHQVDLTVHMVRAEHAALHHTVQQAQCHQVVLYHPVDRQVLTNHLLQAVVLLVVAYVHPVFLAHIVVHTAQQVPTVQCLLAVLPHGNPHGGLFDEAVQ